MDAGKPRLDFRSRSRHHLRAADLCSECSIYKNAIAHGAESGYDFHLGNGDNGNVHQIVNDLDNDRTQDFTYDQLNRLTSVATQGTDCALWPRGQTRNWGNDFVYDIWGNLLQKVPTKCTPENLVLAVDNNNRIIGMGMTYDAAGNLTSDGVWSYAYDAESRMKSAGSYAYTYDGDGNMAKSTAHSKLFHPPTETVAFRHPESQHR